MAEKLLDFSQPFDVGLLDATVAAFYGTGSKEEVHFPCGTLSLRGGRVEIVVAFGNEQCASRIAVLLVLF